MANFLAYLALLGAIVVVFDVLSRLLVWATTGHPPHAVERTMARWPRRRPHPDVDVELLLAQLELRRLAAEVQRVHATDQPHRVHRIRATTGAYDDVLLQCCRLAKVEVPPRHDHPRRLTTLTTRERFEAETALMARGVDW